MVVKQRDVDAHEVDVVLLGLAAIAEGQQLLSHD
jgi:hypothetical protein